MNLKETKVVLASGSPRRIEMLQADGVDPLILRPDCEEDIHMDLTPRQEVMALAVRKNRRAVEMLRDSGSLPDGCIVLSADTMVVFEGRAIGKPKDEEDAFRILARLRGKAHKVLSGACIFQPDSGRLLAFCEETAVHFKDYTDADIRAYIATGEPMDKAGAYAIQGGFAKYVTRTEGPMDNVIGFPYQTIKNILQDW